MHCKNCKGVLTYKKTWMYMFKEPEYLLCDDCYRILKPRIHRSEMYTGHVYIEWFYFLEKKYKVDPLCLIREVTAVFLYKLSKGNIILYFDYFPNEVILSYLESFKENITIITCFGL